jgi:Na+-transporting NADH:ubiquinone oxidoreductase subunit E
MEYYLGLFVRAIFVENMALSVLPRHVHLPRRVQEGQRRRSGSGIAVIVVLTITVPVNNLIYNYLLPTARWPGRDSRTWTCPSSGCCPTSA